MIRIAAPTEPYCSLCEDRPLREPWEKMTRVCDACFGCPLTDGERRLLRAIDAAPELPELAPDEADEDQELPGVDGGAILWLVAALSLACGALCAFALLSR
jgi:hypothetical protein